ncbi:MAG TPA: ATP-binding protein [Smithellaceae bacterium]|nr:ATP-binding protein [Smithellaceae bacterium]HRS88282.1 ATP-binding protein [Smithellaceae bacterium]HRV24927.1 ATP-binding protein [Smithellaceae bacterium]
MEQQDKKRLLSLIIYRAVVITLFLGVAVYLDIKNALSVKEIAIRFFYIIIALTYLISILYYFLLKHLLDVRYHVYLQLAVDIVLITLLVYFTGSASSNYSLLYPLIIIYSVIFLGRRVGLIVASASTIAYGLLLDLEFYNVIPSLILEAYEHKVTVADVFIRILLHMVSFYTIAFLASFVVEQERKTRHLLEEKETEFAQLDLLFRSIIESVDTGIMTIDLQGRIKTFNRAAEEITGYSFRQIENKRIHDIFPEFAALLMPANHCESGRNRMEAVIKTPFEKRINLGCAMSSLKDKNDRQIGNIIIFQDITEIKRMEENLEKSKRLALIGEMAAGLAHEMRNPLASITGSIELLKQEQNLDEMNKRLMQIIIRGKNQLESFVRDFLLLARPLPTTREMVKVNDVIEEVVENVKLSKDWSDNIKINQKFSENVETFANRQQIRQIMHNIILNAIQSMKQGGVLELETSCVKMDGGRDYAQIKVADTGCGIEPANIKKIFEPFFTNKEKGTGLGLTIVGRLVDGYGGKISIESKLGQGTDCIVWLPMNSMEIPPLVA